LSELRRSSGDPRSRLPAIDAIRHLLLANELPSMQECVISRRPTTDTLIVTFSAQVPILPPSPNASWLTFDALASFIFPIKPSWIATTISTAAAPMTRVTVERVPLRVATDCHSQVRGFDATSLAALVRFEPLYARLLDEIPGLLVSVD
jgi:hypothetical protein